MADALLIRIGPVALTTTLGTNLFSPPTVSGGVNAGSPLVYARIRRLRIVNRTASVATFSMWLGSSGANTGGTEVIGQALAVSANSYFDYVGVLRISLGEYLVGGASANNALTLTGEAELLLT